MTDKSWSAEQQAVFTVPAPAASLSKKEVPVSMSSVPQSPAAAAAPSVEAMLNLVRALETVRSDVKTPEARLAVGRLIRAAHAMHLPVEEIAKLVEGG